MKNEWRESYTIEELDDVLNIAINTIEAFLSRNSEKDLFYPIARECTLKSWEAVNKWKAKTRKRKAEGRDRKSWAETG